MSVTTKKCFLYILLALFFIPLIVANPRGGPGNDNDDNGNDGGHDGDGDNDGDGGADNDGDGAATNSPAGGAGGASANLPGTNSTGLGGLQGDMQCPGSELMCVTGIVNGSSITYELQSTGVQPFGWMAIGFGTQMPNTPMVILWANADGSITLSQRQAPAQVMPTPVANPPKVATAVPQLSSLTGSQPKVVFTIPGTASLTNLIWAFGTTKPAEPAGSTLLQHIDSGTFTLDLTKTLPGGVNGTAGINGTSSALPIPKGSFTIPFLPYQKLIIAHAAFVSLGFLILLPSGVLLARLSRTYNNKWFKGHWIIQFALAGPVIITGCILGFIAVNAQGGGETHTNHKTIGVVLLALYIAQCALGAFIHFVKIRVWRFNRPPQNYYHAILGLTILGLSFYQAWLGFTQEWPNSTGRPPVIVAVAYIGGLAYYLPRQLRQEKKSRRRAERPVSIRSNNASDYEEIHELNPNATRFMVFNGNRYRLES
ncbi:hypothetical protein Clacol_010147 [Clathrus columnatus]|uniref:Cytochrome b561 domain-containing protein n=1 Tax=Clathrus columnatus TaxID=1419009 RepID=A0AAV5AMN6_9AGAM|nr:hypothetical protein Clacol_010147 [Clathrus columnatus]